MSEIPDIFAEFPILTTERLQLRQIRPSDVPAIYAIFSDPDVTRFYGMEPYSSWTQADALVARWLKRFSDRHLIRWVITMRNEDDVISTCGFNEWKRGFHCGGVGYDLAKVHWRQGLMSEALTAVVNFGFSQMNLHRIEANVVAENVASIKLLQKLGFKNEGLLREAGYWNQTFHDMILFALLQNDFQPHLSQ